VRARKAVSSNQEASSKPPRSLKPSAATARVVRSQTEGSKAAVAARGRLAPR